MKVKLFARNGELFDTVEVGSQPPCELIVFNDRCWKRSKGGEYHEVKSTFVSLPAQNMWNFPHAHCGAPAGSPPKKFSGGATPLLGS